MSARRESFCVVAFHVSYPFAKPHKLKLGSNSELWMLVLLIMHFFLVLLSKGLTM